MSTERPSANPRLPLWLQNRSGLGARIHGLKKELRSARLHTVCEEARCPNLGECFSRGTATFMLLGDTCTRSCRFCAVAAGRPQKLDVNEPSRVAEQISKMALRHAVITAVARDDIPDGGALHFAQTIKEVRRQSPGTTVEVLTSDFNGDVQSISTVCEAAPDVFNHNLETVERLTPIVRSRAKYRRSLEVLKNIRSILKGGFVKSGIMVGLGETREEIDQTMNDLRESGCEIMTIGQYLRPKSKSMVVSRYVEPEEFRLYEEMGRSKGFTHVFSGPLVRSSYMADEAILHVSSSISR